MRTEIHIRTYSSIVVLIMAIFSVIAFIGTTEIARAQYGIEELQGKDQEVTIDLLGNLELTDHEQKKQKIMVDAAKVALEKMKIPKTTIDLVIYEDKDATVFPEHITYLMPRFGGAPKCYMIKLERRVLKEEDVTLRHAILHQVARIKNGDFDRDNKRSGENRADLEREAEIMIFNTFGREEYLKLWKERYEIEKKTRRQSMPSLNSYLNQILDRLRGFESNATSPPEADPFETIESLNEAEEEK